mmetsp:Transcript_92725/g.233672  ORF Transcript_92725/g.233672 Transcript_92725/m.233672 type:complete len:338 (+) Transcript_92725:1469-2482(+)
MPPLVVFVFIQLAFAFRCSSTADCDSEELSDGPPPPVAPKAAARAAAAASLSATAVDAVVVATAAGGGGGGGSSNASPPKSGGGGGAGAAGAASSSGFAGSLATPPVVDGRRRGPNSSEATSPGSQACPSKPSSAVTMLVKDKVIRATPARSAAASPFRVRRGATSCHPWSRAAKPPRFKASQADWPLRSVATVGPGRTPVPFFELSRTHKKPPPAPSEGLINSSAWKAETPSQSSTMSLAEHRPKRSTLPAWRMKVWVLPVLACSTLMLHCTTLPPSMPAPSSAMGAHPLARPGQPGEPLSQARHGEAGGASSPPSRGPPGRGGRRGSPHLSLHPA